MKIIINLAFILMIGTFFGLASVSAQIPQRIQFAKGKNSATIKGNTGAYGKTYVVNARSGQKLMVTVSSAPGLGVKIEKDGADGEMVLLREERGGTYEIGLEENGDYTIFVGSTNQKSVPFTLTVKITKMKDI